MSSNGWEPKKVEERGIGEGRRHHTKGIEKEDTCENRLYQRDKTKEINEGARGSAAKKHRGTKKIKTPWDESDKCYDIIQFLKRFIANSFELNLRHWKLWFKVINLTLDPAKLWFKVIDLTLDPANTVPYRKKHVCRIRLCLCHTIRRRTAKNKLKRTK